MSLLCKAKAGDAKVDKQKREPLGAVTGRQASYSANTPKRHGRGVCQCVGRQRRGVLSPVHSGAPPTPLDLTAEPSPSSLPLRTLSDRCVPDFPLKFSLATFNASGSTWPSGFANAIRITSCATTVTCRSGLPGEPWRTRALPDCLPLRQV
jgi:hypothetical protein